MIARASVAAGAPAAPYTPGMAEDEKAVLEEALENLREAAQRIRAVSNRMHATGMREDTSHHDLAHHVVLTRETRRPGRLGG